MKLKNFKLFVEKLEDTKEDIEKSIVTVNILYKNYEGKDTTGQIEVHKDIKNNIELVFKDLYEIEFPINMVDKSYGRDDEDIILDNITTGYNFRYVKGTTKLSKHARGYAIDLNPKVNPAKPSQMSHVYDESINTGKITDNIVNIFKNRGFKWGGEIFGNFLDLHHFEI